MKIVFSDAKCGSTVSKKATITFDDGKSITVSNTSPALIDISQWLKVNIDFPEVIKYGCVPVDKIYLLSDSMVPYELRIWLFENADTLSNVFDSCSEILNMKPIDLGE